MTQNHYRGYDSKRGRASTIRLMEDFSRTMRTPKFLPEKDPRASSLFVEWLALCRAFCLARHKQNLTRDRPIP